MLNSEIKWVGDLSIEDAKILVEYSNGKDVVEFGCGGSTLIFSQSSATKLVSVETDFRWTELTQKRLATLKNQTPVTFFEYNSYNPEPTDVVFVDGIDSLRLDFAIKNWPFLRVGGVMIFHDTRRAYDFQNAAHLMQTYHNEVKNVYVNHNNSNMTIIQKKSIQPYVNWNLTEGKPFWAYGNPVGVEDTCLWEGM
jgi:predicted O-methyltransferase YrrM